MPSQSKTSDKSSQKKRRNDDDMIDISASDTEGTESEYDHTETEDDEEDDDGLESGDEEILTQSEKLEATRSVFYNWGSSKVIESGTEKYEVTRVGREFDAAPNDKTPLPGAIREWSEVRVIDSGDFISAYCVRDSSNRNIVRYYLRTGQPQWQEQAKKMLPEKMSTPLTHGLLANLSLHLHGIVSPNFKPDPDLLKHDDLANFRLEDGKVAHIYDTPYAKKYLHRQKKNAERSAAKKAAAKKGSSLKPKPVPEVAVSGGTTLTVSLPPFPHSPKKAKAKASAESPSKSPQAAKPKSPARPRPRQLKLGGKAAVEKEDPPSAPGTGDFTLDTELDIFRPLVEPLQAIMRQIGVRVVPSGGQKRKLGDCVDSSPRKKPASKK